MELNRQAGDTEIDQGPLASACLGGGAWEVVSLEELRFGWLVWFWLKGGLFCFVYSGNVLELKDTPRWWHDQKEHLAQPGECASGEKE